LRGKVDSDRCRLLYSGVLVTSNSSSPTSSPIALLFSDFRATVVTGLYDDVGGSTRSKRHGRGAMSDSFDEPGVGMGGTADVPSRSGVHCDACNEWMDAYDANCPNCGSER